MIVTKSFTLKGILKFSGGHLIWLTLWSSIVVLTYRFMQWKWMNIPWLPLSVIGTAVAFYIGFKNNQAYDRLWEARKIWGAIVNSSRSWGSTVKGFIGTTFTKGDLTDNDVKIEVKKLIYRHIAWVYTLRSQLLIPTSWEHVSQGHHIGETAKKRRDKLGIGLTNDEVTKKELEHFLNKEEYQRIINYRNSATQLIDQQSQDLKQLRELKLIDDFRHMELQKILNDLYTHQGKAERIKKFPLPRQYGSMSLIFVILFIILLPFGVVSEFHKLGDYGIWLAIPFTVLIGWIYVMMELVGDYSENPFEGLANDIPMLSLCRTIEIDLMEMLNEKDIPEPIKAKNGVLM
jgi:putative membrane protein